MACGARWSSFGDGDGDPASWGVGLEDECEVDGGASVEAVSGDDLHSVGLNHMGGAELSVGHRCVAGVVEAIDQRFREPSGESLAALRLVAGEPSDDNLVGGGGGVLEIRGSGLVVEMDVPVVGGRRVQLVIANPPFLTVTIPC